MPLKVCTPSATLPRTSPDRVLTITVTCAPPLQPVFGHRPNARTKIGPGDSSSILVGIGCRANCGRSTGGEQFVGTGLPCCLPTGQQLTCQSPGEILYPASRPQMIWASGSDGGRPQGRSVSAQASEAFRSEYQLELALTQVSFRFEARTSPGWTRNNQGASSTVIESSLR